MILAPKSRIPRPSFEIHSVVYIQQKKIEEAKRKLRKTEEALKTVEEKLRKSNEQANSLKATLTTAEA